MRRAVRSAAIALLACGVLATVAPAAPLGVPIPSATPAGGRVRWSRPANEPSTHAVPAARLRAARDRADSLAAWGTALGDSVLRPYALHRSAGLQLAAGDSVGADATLSALVRESSLWQWVGLRARYELARARGLTGRADSLLAGVGRESWPDEERAQWLARRVETRLALGDTAGAITFARQMIARYPTTSPAAGTLRVLEALVSAGGDSLNADDEAFAAEIERVRGRREQAAARLARSAPRGSGTVAAGRYVRLARVLRELRRFAEARNAAAAGLRSASTLKDSTDARLEQARSFRDAGDGRQALAAYAETGNAAPGDGTEAWWERARYLDERGEWKAARDDYARVVAADGERAELATLRAGLMSIAAGEPAVALEWFARRDSEGTRFWRGVVLRASGRQGGDSLLRTVAARPGYTFYRSAARDTLGVLAWPGIAPARQPTGTEPGIRLARALDDLGCGPDAAFVMDRWYAHDARVFRAVPISRPGPFLDAAAAAYAADRPRQAVRFVDRFLARSVAERDSVRWSASPWLYPPAHDSLFAAWPESAAAGKVDRALLQAVAWKESHFDPLARSRSDAFGLLQLKRPAVQDVARWLRESPPSDSALADPALNLRYGAEYLQRQLTRFGGDLPLALAAYNAGPTVAKRWTRLRALGGDALACEEIDFPETQDYVKTILAVRQAYRELRPTLAP